MSGHYDRTGLKITTFCRLPYINLLARARARHTAFQSRQRFLSSFQVKLRFFIICNILTYMQCHQAHAAIVHEYCSKSLDSRTLLSREQQNR